MNLYRIACLALAATALAQNAWSAETAGRITYISPDHSQLMLDNSRMYTLANGEGAAKVAVGERVELQLDQAGGKVTEITKLS